MKKRTLALIAIVLLASFALSYAPTLAQDDGDGGGSDRPAPTVQWEYREISFSEKVTFASPVGDEFFINGEAREANDPEMTVLRVLNMQGRNGWELVTVIDGQYFIFKRIDTGNNQPDDEAEDAG